MRKNYARKSADFVCEQCGPVREIITKIPQEEGTEDLKKEVPDDFLVHFKPEANKQPKEPVAKDASESIKEE